MSGSTFLSLPTLIATAILSLAAAVPLSAPPQEKETAGHALEVSMASSRAGFVQLFYRDDSGAMSESNSSRMPVEPGTTPRRYQLALPVGMHRELRLDPLDRPGSVTIESARIVTSSGRSLRSIALSELMPQNEIESAKLIEGRLEIQTTAGAEDPQLALPLDPPLEIRLSWWQRLPLFWRRAAEVLALIVVLLVGLDRLPRVRRSLAGCANALAARPVRALAVIAAGAVMVSAYPVVFLGKSFVSPNYVPLLYDHMPTLPEATSVMIATGRGSDVGAMMWQHLPYSVIQRRALAQGELPLWNRYNSLGAPLLGQGQSMAGDPLHLGVVLAGGAAWAWDAKFLVAKWLFALGLGLVVLRLTRHLGAALLVAFATPFIGFFLVRINHPSYFSLCYAPWPLYAWLSLAAARTRRALAWSGAGLLAANFVLMNSGTVKEAYLLVLVMNFSGACVVLGNGASWRSRGVTLAVAAWTALLLALVTAPVWSTFLHTLRNAQTNYEAAAAYQIPPALLLGAFDEAFFRLIMPEEYVSNASLNFLLLLGLLYFLSTWGEQRGNRAARSLALSALIPFALAFGLVPASWLTAVPLVGRVLHIDHCFLAALIVLWSVLAGVGFATAARRLAMPTGRTDLWRVACGLAALLGAWIAFRQVVHRGTFTMLQHGQTLLVSGFVWGYLATLLVATSVLVFTVRRCLQRRALTPAAGIVLLLCGAVLLWRHALHGEGVGFDRHVVRPAPRANLQAHSGAMDYVRAAHEREPGRGFGLRHNLMAGWSVIYGVEGINGPDALMNPWYRDLLARGAPSSGGWEITLRPEQVQDVRRFFDAINVRYYVAPRGDAALLGQLLKPAGSFDLDVWESPTAWPRAFFTDRVGLYDRADDLVSLIKSGDGRAFAALPRGEQSVLPEVGRDLADRQVIAARNYHLTENTTSFQIQASGPGVVVLSELFWPGDFRVEVNGAKGRVLRINHAFKGVAVDRAGDYRITFRYVPRNFPRNLVLCGAGTLLGLLSLSIALRRPAPMG